MDSATVATAFPVDVSLAHGLDTSQSAKLFDTACGPIPGGVNSTARATWSGWTPYPLFVESGQGSRLTDVDGNEYIDYLLGLGYEVHGIVRRVALEAPDTRFSRIAHLLDRITLHPASLESYPSIFHVLSR